MRGRLPLPPIPGKTVGGGVPDAPRRLAPTSFPGLPPAETPAAANNSPCLPPWGKVAPQGRMRGRLPLPPIPGQTAGGGVPAAPRKLAPPSIPRVITRGDSHCRQHPRRGQDPSLRTEPLTGACVNPRAGHARPLPCGGPGTGVRVNPAGVSISPSVGRGAPTPPRPPAAANTPGGMNPSTTALAFPLGGRWPRRAG